MTNLTPAATFDDVQQLETTTVALGGPGAPMNVQAQALLNRTQYLYVQLSNLAAVATTGDYNSLINRPALGSAAYQPSSAFATAAQGAKADGAAQANALAPVAFSGSYLDLTNKPSVLTNPMTSAGDIIIGGSSGTPMKLGIGAIGQVLGVVAAGMLGYLTPLTNPMTSPSDLIVGGVGGAATRLAAGAPGTVPTIQDDGTLAYKAPVTGIPTALPEVPWFAPSGVTVVAPTAGQPAGDPFIVWDADAGVFRMFYWKLPSGVAVYMRTAPTIEGPWSSESTVSGLTNYHKFVVLVDVYGAPVKIGGNYHGYAVYYDGTNISSKTIYHFTASTLAGPWTVASNVIPHGASGSWDGFANDACYATYDKGTIYLWYMAEPDTSQTDYGFASRMMLATSTTPDSGFTKDYVNAVIDPGTTGTWDYGWIGGMQIRKMSTGAPFVMFYNAGDTRPSSGGLEPDTSRIGVAYANSLSGPWTKLSSNPILTLSNLPSDALEKTDLWRPHVAYDPTLKRWNLFYNTSAASSGGELVTYARANVYDYQYYPSPSGGGQIMTLTTAEQSVNNSKVNVQPGIYRVRAQLNIIADASGSLPKLNVTTWLRAGGSTHYQQTVDFIGSYAYENRDSMLEKIIAVNQATYLDVSAQVTSGTPLSSTYARNLRLNVERIQ